MESRAPKYENKDMIEELLGKARQKFAETQR